MATFFVDGDGFDLDFHVGAMDDVCVLVAGEDRDDGRPAVPKVISGVHYVAFRRIDSAAGLEPLGETASAGACDASYEVAEELAFVGVNTEKRDKMI